MNTATFIEQLYTKFLGRNSDTAGLAYWGDQIDSNKLNAAQVTQLFIDSQEFTGHVSPIAQIYYAALGRIPDAEGLLYWVNTYQKGHSLTEISESFVQSDEFENNYKASLSDNSKFLELLYNNVFGRAADSEGKAYWLDKMNNGINRAEVVTNFANSGEFFSLKSEDIKVLLKYHGIIGTQPTQAEIDAAKSANDPIELINQLYTSDSYKGVTVPGLSNTTPDTAGPIVIYGPTRSSDTSLSLTIDENGTAGVYAFYETTCCSSLIGNSINLTANTLGEITVGAQTNITQAHLIIEDEFTNHTESSGVVLGTSNDDHIRYVSDDIREPTADKPAFIFTFDGSDKVFLGDAPKVVDGGSGSDTIHWTSIDADRIASRDGVEAGTNIDFSSGKAGDDIIFISGEDKLSFEEQLLTNAQGEENNTLLKIEKGGVVTDTARFVHITNTNANDHSEKFTGAKTILDGLDTKAISPGDRFIAAIDNDTDTFLYLVQQVSASDTIAEQDITLIGRLNGVTNVTDGDFTTADTNNPILLDGPTRVSSSEISLTVNESATAVITADSQNVTPVIDLTGGIEGTLPISAQPIVTNGYLSISDAANNNILFSMIGGYKFTLGTSGDDVLQDSKFAFGFEGNDKIINQNEAGILDGGEGADTYQWQATSSNLLISEGGTYGNGHDFISGLYGDDIYFDSGLDKLAFSEELLPHATGVKNNSLLKITKAGTVVDTARFVHITNANANDHAERFNDAQTILNGLDTSAIAIGDSFIAAIDNDVDTYLYMVNQKSEPDTIEEQDIILIGRLNGETDLVDGDFLTY